MSTILKELRPLLVIILMITYISLITSSSIEVFSLHFMAGFFLVFGSFKLMDLPGFVRGYQKYDLLAHYLPIYGYLYAFLELSLGTLYALGITDYRLHLFTLCLMLFSGLGVLNAMRKHMDVRCACLGTLLNVPLSRVTLVEDFGMAAMALWMLLS